MNTVHAANQLSWSAFSGPYQQANKWGDYPVDFDPTPSPIPVPQNGRTDHVDIFKNHGSKESFDIVTALIICTVSLSLSPFLSLPFSLSVPLSVSSARILGPPR